MTNAASDFRLLRSSRKRRLESFPLPRHFHGPQPHGRIRLSFCSSPFFPPPPPDVRDPAFHMGNFLSRVFGGHPKDGGLGLYRNWTDAQRQTGDLTVITDEEEGTPAHLVRRRYGDPRKAALAAVPPPPRKPYYKEALEATRRFDPRLKELGSEVKLQEEILAKQQQLHKVSKEDLSEVFKPLTADEVDEVHGYLNNRSLSRKILVVHEPSNIEVSTEKFRCLRSGGWLNDEVINLYLELLKERENREPKRFLKCHFFNTFFYKKLACGKNGYDYKSVKRWTTQRKLGYELIECDKIFVPVHKDIHWCLAVINMKKKTFQYLDSLGGMDPNVLKILAQYIAEEVKDKSNRTIDTNSWHEAPVDDIPLQQNGWDCGMFMLKYIDFYSRGLSLRFGQEHMEYFRKRTAKEILRLRAE